MSTPNSIDLMSMSTLTTVCPDMPGSHRQSNTSSASTAGLTVSAFVDAQRMIALMPALVIALSGLSACGSSAAGDGPYANARGEAGSDGGGRAAGGSAQGGSISSGGMSGMNAINVSGAGNETAGGAGNASGQGGAGGDTSTDDSGASSCPLNRDFAPPCNALIPSGPPVTSTCSTTAPPPAEGGTPVDGVYELETATWYGDCQDTQTVQSTWLVCGDLWDVAVASNAMVTRTNYTSAEQGTAVTLNPICVSQGSAAGTTRDFSVAPGKLTLESHHGTSTLVNTYALKK